MTASTIIAADFDRARREMLQGLRRMIAADRATADEEIEATYAAMLQLITLEEPHRAG